MGCNSLRPVAPAVTSTGSLRGSVHGGQQPVNGATIQLFAVGAAGTGSASIPLIANPPKSGADGSFGITGMYTCPSFDTAVYLTATGGDPGLGAVNPSSVLMTALGLCGYISASNNIVVDESTTVASVYSLAPWLSGYAQIGADLSEMQQLKNGFSQVNEYINTDNGRIPGFGLAPGLGVPSAKLYALANIVAACINSGGGVAGDNSPCGNLFLYATPPGGAAPTDTVVALRNIALNPAHNVDSLYNLSPSSAVFQPTLSSAPSDWTLTIEETMTLSAPSNLAGVGTTGAGVITIGLPAPAGGLTIAVTSANPAALSVPSTVKIAAGQTSAPFNYTGLSTGLANVTAAAVDHLGSAYQFSVVAPSLTLGALPTVSAPSGVSLPLSLRSAAPAGGLTIDLASTDPSVAAVYPARVTIPAGEYAPTLLPQVQGNGMGIAQITAVAPGLAAVATTAAVGVNASLPASLNAAIDAPGVQTLTLSGAAPVGGLTFTLTTDDPLLVKVPATVGIPAGATSVDFPVTGVTIGDTTIRAVAPGIPPVSAAVRALFHTCSLWGDSLSQGNEDSSGVTVETALQASGYCDTVFNEGIGGQWSSHIAIRMGAEPSTATITSGVIPASGYTPIVFPPLAGAVSDQGPPQPLTINGVDGLGYTNTDIGTTVFQRNTPGLPVLSPPNSSVTVHPPDVLHGLVIIWAGTNNWQNPDQVKGDLAAMVAHLPADAHYLIMSPINTDYFWFWLNGGQTPYYTLLQLNQDIAAIYPSNYIDIRSLVTANYDPNNAEDVIDHIRDVPPSSSRAIDFGGTLQTPLDATNCTFTVTQNNGWYGSVLIMEGEKIRITEGDGTNVTTCIRGFANTTAAPHAVGAPYRGIDPVHLNGPVGDVFIAKKIVEWLRAR